MYLHRFSGFLYHQHPELQTHKRNCWIADDHKGAFTTHIHHWKIESLQNPKESIITAKETGESAFFQWDSICYIVSLLLVKRDRSSRLGTTHACTQSHINCKISCGCGSSQNRFPHKLTIGLLHNHWFLIEEVH